MANNIHLRVKLKTLVLMPVQAMVLAIAPVLAVASDTAVKTELMAVEPALLDDSIAPETFITVPIKNYTAGRTTVFKGYATDTGGSGISRVQVAIRDSSTEQWFNFAKKSIWLDKGHYRHAGRYS